jgi:cobalamin biosynthesis protein CbiG
MIVLSALTSASLLSRHAICVCDVLKQANHHIETDKFEDFITIHFCYYTASRGVCRTGGVGVET